MAFTPIVGTLCYLWDRDSDRVLLVRRDARPDDDHFGKVNGLGGKLEVGEHVVAGMRRELHEEAGIEVTSLKLRGTITWTDFGPRDENWLGFVFLADAWQGDPPESNEEGNLIWVPRSLLLAACDPDPETRRATGLVLWDGDRHFLPLVFDDDPRPFHGDMPYDGDRAVGWTFERL